MKKFLIMTAMFGVLFAGFVIAQDKPAAPAPAVKAKPGFQAPPARMNEALQLTPDQEAKLKAFRESRQAENKAFADEMIKLQGDLRAFRQDPKADPAKVDALIDKVFKLRADRAKAGIRNAQAWRAIFTPEQLEKMKRGGPMMGRGPGMDMARPFGQRGPGMGMARPFGRRGPGAMGRDFRPLRHRPWMDRMRGPSRSWGWRWDEF